MISSCPKKPALYLFLSSNNMLAGLPACRTDHKNIEMLSVFHIWCIYYTCVYLVGILQVGVGHVYMQVEAWWEGALSKESSVSLTPQN